MVHPELTERNSAPQEVSTRIEKRAQKHIAIGTWAVSRNEPNLFYWRNHDSYDSDLYLLGEISSEADIDGVAREEVASTLVFEGIDKKRAIGAIKGVQQSGRIALDFLEDGENGIENRRRVIPMVFVEMMPSVLRELTKRGVHFLHPAWALRPRSKRNNSEERSIKGAFKKFAAQKTSGSSGRS